MRRLVEKYFDHFQVKDHHPISFGLKATFAIVTTLLAAVIGFLILKEILENISTHW